MRRIRELRGLVHDAIDAITGLVEETHEQSARTPVELIAKLPGLDAHVRQVDGVRSATSKLVFDSVRAVNRGVQTVGDALGKVVEKALPEQLMAEVEQALPSEARAVVHTVVDSAQGALNALVGDYLKARSNGLAIEMGFWTALVSGQPQAIPLTPEGVRAALPDASGKLCIFVHGLGCTEAVWHPGPVDVAAGLRADYGAMLTRERGFTCVYLRYNSGLHISENGRELAQRIEQLVDSYPLPVQQLVLVGHSMGGLVCRSAAHYAGALSLRFLPKLSHLLCIGSPHMGAPLERAGNALSSLLGLFDVAGTQVPAKILNARSAGIKDLRFGYVLDEEWTGSDPDAFLRDARRDVPLAEHVVCGFVAASYFPKEQGSVGEWLGDLLVGVSSASGQCAQETRHIPFHLGHVLHGVHHQALLTHPEVEKQLLRFLDHQRDAAC